MVLVATSGYRRFFFLVANNFAFQSMYIYIYICSVFILSSLLSTVDSIA